MHSQAFRSNLPVAGQNLPFMILFDDSVYTIIQVQVAAAIVTKEKKATVCEELNALNDQYRMLKYSVDGLSDVKFENGKLTLQLNRPEVEDTH